MALNFRNLFPFMVPSWLYNDDGGKVLHALMILQDGYQQWARDALEARFPSRAGASALALIGDDRGILRGRTEAADHYATRLKAWRYPRGHRTRGSAFALLEQVCEYFGGIRAWTIDQNKNRHERSATGVQTFSYEYPWTWDNVPSTPNWARFWLVLTPVPDEPTIKPWPPFSDPTCWGGGFGVDGTTIGQQGVTADDVNAIRRLFKGRAWKPAGTQQLMAIVGMLDHNTASPPVPDGTWNLPANRDANFRFWELS